MDIAHTLNSVAKECPVEDRFIRWPEVKKITAISRTTAWRLERNGQFPKRRQLASQHSVGWLRSEITEWIETRIAVGEKS